MNRHKNRGVAQKVELCKSFIKCHFSAKILCFTDLKHQDHKIAVVSSEKLYRCLVYYL